MSAEKAAVKGVVTHVVDDDAGMRTGLSRLLEALKITYTEEAVADIVEAISDCCLMNAKNRIPPTTATPINRAFSVFLWYMLDMRTSSITTIAAGRRSPAGPTQSATVPSAKC
jgi:hypothetical protein